MNTFGSKSISLPVHILADKIAVFQTYYETGHLFASSSSNIAWIGAVNTFLVLFIGFLSGPTFDRGYLKALLAFGAFMTVLGYMMLSLCTRFWQVLLAQGFAIGIGGGCLFVPAVAVLPGYFRARLGLALGIAASGSSMGGIIYPITFYRLIDRIGFAWTTRVIGFIALATLAVPVAFMKQRAKPNQVRELIDRSVFHDGPYLLFLLACFFGFCGLYTVLFYISYFGASTHIADTAMSFYIVPILNAASVFGRTVPNWLADTTGPINLITPGALITSILIYCMLAVDSLAGLVVQAVFLGFFTGVFVSLPPLCFARLTQDKSKLGTRMGMGFGTLSITVLLGGPATGQIIGDDLNNLHWNSSWAWGGSLVMASAVLFFTLRLWISKGTPRYKV